MDEHIQKHIVVVSLCAGSGHRRAAEAIKKTAEQSFPDLHVTHVDACEYMKKSTKKTLVDSYTLMARQAPELWGFLYEKTDNQKLAKRWTMLMRKLRKAHSKKLYDHVISLKPDYVLFTHFLPADLIYQAVNKEQFSIPTGMIVTDYGIHELWIVPEVQDYFVSTKKMVWQLQHHGIPTEHVVQSGIPIDPIFSIQKDIQMLKQEYRLPTDIQILLILSGGQGLSDTEQTIKTLINLDEPTVIIAITGKNTRLEKKLRHIVAPAHIDLRIINWTDNIDNYMRIADVIITKPGGLTTTECIALGKPIIAVDPIPGQEEHNAQFILEEQHGTVARRPDDIHFYVKTKKYIDSIANAPGSNAATRILSHIKQDKQLLNNQK